MKQSVLRIMLLTLAVGTTFGIVLDPASPEDSKLISTKDLNLEDVEDLNMSDEQKQLLMKNFRAVGKEYLSDASLLTPDRPHPGDVVAVGMEPKSLHLVERTPNLKYYPESRTRQQVHTIVQPLTIMEAKQRLVTQDIQGPKQVIVKEPISLIPNVIEQHADKTVLSAPSALNAPDIGVSPNGQRSMPTIDIPAMNKAVPSLQIEAHPDINMPEIQIGNMDKQLETLQVDAIESHALPEINAPVLEKAVPSIVLPEEEAIPSIGLPNMDRRMDDFTVPTADPTITAMTAPSIDRSFSDFDVNIVDQGAFSDFNVPDQKNDMAAFNVPLARFGDMSHQFDDIRLPNVEEVAEPQLKVINLDDKAAHRLADIQVTNVPHDIRHPQVENVEFPALKAIDVPRPGIADVTFGEIAPLQVPTAHMPPMGLMAKIREPKQLQVSHEQLIAKNQQVIDDHVVFVPNVIVAPGDRIQMPKFRIREPQIRDQDFIFPTRYCPPGEEELMAKKVVVKKPARKVIVVAAPAPEPVVDENPDLDVAIPEEVAADLEVDPMDLVVEEPVDNSDNEGNDFIYDFSFLKDRPNEVADMPNTFRGSRLYLQDNQGNARPYQISSRDIDGALVGSGL